MLCHMLHENLGPIYKPRESFVLILGSNFFKERRLVMYSVFKCIRLLAFTSFTKLLSVALTRLHLPIPARRLDKNLGGVREKSRLRARSEHSRLGRVGRALVTPQRF